jgi:hypothetical protein
MSGAGGCGVACSAFSRADCASIGDQIGGVVLGNSQSGHECAAVPGAQGEGERVPLSSHSLRVHDEVDQPVMVPARRDAAQVGTRPVAYADRVAGCADALEQGLPRRAAELIGGIAVGVAAGRAHLGAPFRVHAAHVHDEALDVAQRVVARPLAGGVVAEHDFLTMLVESPASLPELRVDRPDVLRLSGQE